MHQGSRARIGVIALCSLLASAATGAPAAAPPGPDAEKEVLAAEQARFDAMTRGDRAALAPMLAEELVYTHSNGIVQSKAELLEALRSGHLRYEAIERQEARVALYGEAAVVTGRCTMRVVVDGTPMAATMRFTEISVKRGGLRRLAAWQSTRIPEP